MIFLLETYKRRGGTQIFRSRNIWVATERCDVLLQEVSPAPLSRTLAQNRFVSLRTDIQKEHIVGRGLAPAALLDIILGRREQSLALQMIILCTLQRRPTVAFFVVLRFLGYSLLSFINSLFVLVLKFH